MNTTDLFDRFFVGFEPLLRQITDTTKYPPYNIKKIDENKFMIELAVAGFDKNDLDVAVDGQALVIKGRVHRGEQAEKDSNNEVTWPAVLYNGLAFRPFEKKFTLANNVEVDGVQLSNGILRVYLVKIVPEKEKARRIEINVTQS